MNQVAALYANEGKAVLTSEQRERLPDSAYACPEKRLYPHHTADGSLDLPHLRNALSRVNQAGTDSCGKAHLEAHARAEGIGDRAKAETLDPDELSAWLTGKRPRALLAIPFGGPLPSPAYAKGMDLDGEFFSERTDIKPRWFDARPITWQHGDDRRMGNEPLGKATNLSLEDDGWWVQTWITAQDQRLSLIRQMAEELGKRGGAFYGSSAPIGRFVKTAKSGEILVWPYAEQTLGTVVQNTKSVLRPGKAIADFDAAGIDMLPALRDILSELESFGSPSDPPPGMGGDGAKSGRVLSRQNEADIDEALAVLDGLSGLDKLIEAAERLRVVLSRHRKETPT